MLVETDLLPELEEVFRVTLELGADRLETTARVAYVQPPPEDEPDAACEIGLGFVELDGEQRKRLKAIVRAVVASSSARYVGNPETGVFHLPDCQHAPSCTLAFPSRRAAASSGLRPGACCIEGASEEAR